ncbi:MAG: RidA family protein [Pseudomonadota bacterium]
MLKKFNPDGIMKPFNNAYHHGVVIPADAEVLHISGQVGVRPDETLPDTIEEEAEQAWANVMAVVAGAGMSVENIVKINAYLTDDTHYGAFAAARAKVLGDARPASTGIIVKRLVLPEWHIEIDCVAAKVP